MMWPKDEHAPKILSPHFFPRRLSLSGTTLQGCTKYTERLPEAHSLPCCPCYRSFWLVDGKTTRETRSVSQQLRHQDLKDCQRQIGVKVPVVEDIFPCLQDIVLPRSAILSSIFTSKLCMSRKLPTVQTLIFVSAPYSNELTNYLLYLKPGLNTW